MNDNCHTLRTQDAGSPVQTPNLSPISLVPNIFSFFIFPTLLFQTIFHPTINLSPPPTAWPCDEKRVLDKGTRESDRIMWPLTGDKVVYKKEEMEKQENVVLESLYFNFFCLGSIRSCDVRMKDKRTCPKAVWKIQATPNLLALLVLHQTIAQYRTFLGWISCVDSGISIFTNIMCDDGL